MILVSILLAIITTYLVLQQISGESNGNKFIFISSLKLVVKSLFLKHRTLEEEREWKHL